MNKLVVYGLLIFSSGLAVGVLSQKLYSTAEVSAKVAPPKPEDWRKRYVGEMTQRVSLTPEQVSQLEAILDESRTLYHQVKEKYRPEMAAIYQAELSKIRALLNPSQIPAYETYAAEREARRKEWESKKR